MGSEGPKKGSSMKVELDRRALALGLGASALLSPPAFGQTKKAGANGLIERADSPYNTIFVIQEGPLISMLFGVNRRLFTESQYDPRDPKSLPVAYTRYMTVALPYVEAPKSLLQIGLGGGRTASYLNLHMPALKIEAAELDPEVVRLAKKYFGVKTSPNFAIFERDGRMHLRQARLQYDLIFVDAYRGTFVPFHLLTQEFFMLAKQRLAPGGVIAQNIEPTTMLYDAAIATLKAVFANVDTYEAQGNVVAIAYDGAPRTAAQLQARAATLQNTHKFRHPIAPMLSLRRQTPARVSGRVLRDDFAPVESLRAIENHNRKRAD
jgi:spermidine synthase